jgi:hypothetical protein
MRRITRTLAAAALVAAVALTGCGTATHSASSASPARSATRQVPSANVQVCPDYAQQRAWIKSLGVTPTLVELVTIGAMLKMDVSYSTGRLHKDFASEAAGYDRVLNGGTPTHRQSTAYQRVAKDCSALGVKV